MRIFGVILAGGSGRRMGGADKALLQLAGRPLIRHVQDRLEPQVEQLFLSANGASGRFDFTGLRVLPDDTPQGPLSGILAALEAAEGADAIVSAPVDTPFLPCDLVPHLWAAAEGGLALACSNGRAHPTCALWPRHLRGDLRRYLEAGHAKVSDFCDAYAPATVGFPGTPDPFMNLNTPADLIAAQALLDAEG